MNAIIQKELTDEQLAAQLQLGNTNAMAKLYSRYYMLVFSKCLSFAKNTDDASDLAQDVMLRVMEKINSFKGESKFSTWLYAVTFNYCTDQIRKNKKHLFESVDNMAERVDCFNNEYQDGKEKSINEELAGQALQAISEQDKQLLLMKYQYNKSIQDLQEMYNLSASAVKMRLKRARSKASSIYVSNVSTAA